MVVKYESRTFKAHTYQQLRQESGARLYAIGNSLSLFANSEQRLRSAGFGYCDTELAIKPVTTQKSSLYVTEKSSDEISSVSTHYQLRQASTAFIETEQVVEPRYVKSVSAESVIRLQQSSVSEAVVSLPEIPVVKQSLTTAEAKTVIRLQQQSVSQAFISDNIVDEHANNIVADCRQYQAISQSTSGKCEVSNDDEEMTMVLLLLESMDA